MYNRWRLQNKKGNVVINQFFINFIKNISFIICYEISLFYLIQ